MSFAVIGDRANDEVLDPAVCEGSRRNGGRVRAIRYDANENESIEIGELFTAADDYFAGGINVSQLFALIDLYFASPE